MTDSNDPVSKPIFKHLAMVAGGIFLGVLIGYGGYRLYDYWQPKRLAKKAAEYSANTASPG